MKDEYDFSKGLRGTTIKHLTKMLEGIEVEEECICQRVEYDHLSHAPCQDTGKIRRPATLEDIDLKDLINHYDYPCDKDHAPKTPTGGKLVVKH